MDVPGSVAIALLNLRGLDWLEQEAARWFEIYRTAPAADKPAIKVYLDAVLAEQKQRAQQYQTISGTIMAGAAAPFEALGGSGGAGAAGVSAAVVDTSKEVAKGVLSAGKGLAVGAFVLALVVGGIYAYGRAKNQSRARAA